MALQTVPAVYFDSLSVHLGVPEMLARLDRKLANASEVSIAISLYY